MTKLNRAGTCALWGGIWYLWTNALAESGYEAPQIIVNTIDSIAEWALDILGSNFSQIGDLAPVSGVFIEELSTLLANINFLDAGIAAWVGYWAGWLGGKGSKILGSITKTPSEHDDKVAKIWIGSAGALGILWASASAITIGAWTAGYVIGRKLGEKILWEKYAKLLGVLWSVWWVGLAWWLGTGTVLWAWAVAVGGGLIWSAWEKQRAERRTERKEKWFMKAHLWIWWKRKS